MKRQTDNISLFYNSIEHYQMLENALAVKLGLPQLESGNLVIRDENGWRENEKSIAHVWIVYVSRSFVGWGGVFEVRFNEHKFREHANEEELIQGVFISNETGIEKFYTESLPVIPHEATGLFSLNLFFANAGMTLDGVNYTVRIIAPNIDTFVKINNPNTTDWKKWEAEIWAMGSRLAKKSADEALISLFEKY